MVTKARKSLLAHTSSAGASEALPVAQSRFGGITQNSPSFHSRAGSLCTMREVDTRLLGFTLMGLLWTDPEKCGRDLWSASISGFGACQRCHPRADGNCNVAVELL